MSVRRLFAFALFACLTIGAAESVLSDTPSPSFQGTKLNGAYWGIASDGTKTIAVGPGGAVARKIPQADWSRAEAAGKPLLLATTIAKDGSVLAVGGTGFTSGTGVILKSSDGGSSFVQVAAPAAPLYEVKFAADGAGYAVGVDGLLLKSADAGQSWNRIETNGATKLWALHFFSDQEGLVAGGETPWQNDQRSSGEILRTSDGGATWENVYEGRKRISDFSFPEKDLGYAAGVGGILFKTTDAGRSWHEVGQTPLKAIVNAVEFLTETCGVIVGAGGTAHITRDGGQSWVHHVTITEGSFLEDLSSDTDDAQAFWVAGGDGSLGRIHLSRFCDN